MTTFLTMQTRIANETVRSNMNARIQEAIQSAIAFYENVRFYFNEARGISVTTVLGQDRYTSADNADIPYLQQIDSILCNVGTGQQYTLDRTTQEYLDTLVVGTSSDYAEPLLYAYYARALRLYPVPDASTYTLSISGVKKLAALSADGDTNAWMVEGEELIRSRAKWYLYTHLIRDQGAAQMMKQAESEALTALQIYGRETGSTGRIIATHF